MSRNQPFRNGAWFNNQIMQRTLSAMEEKQKQFVQQHKHSTDQQLLEYVIQCAKKLGHSPQACEVTGGDYIASRFGSWVEVLIEAGLPPAGKAPELEKREIYREEYDRQIRMFKHERHVRRLEQARSRSEKSAQRKMEQKKNLDADMAWGEENSGLSSLELLKHIQKYANELGYTPHRREVPGGRYIAQHFGSWAVALTLAELPLPKDLKPPKETVLEMHRNKLKKESKNM